MRNEYIAERPIKNVFWERIQTCGMQSEATILENVICCRNKLLYQKVRIIMDPPAYIKMNLLLTDTSPTADIDGQTPKPECWFLWKTNSHNIPSLVISHI